MLTDTKIRNSKPATKAYHLKDHDGLYLDIRPSGSKTWRVRLWVAKKEVRYTVGDYPVVSLADARRTKDEVKAKAKTGINPNQEKQEQALLKNIEDANTLEAIAEEWLNKTEGRRTINYQLQIRRAFAKDVYPAIGAMPIKAITPAHVLRIIQSVEGRGAPCVAINIKMWLSAIFRYAIATLRAGIDPAEPLRGIIERPKVQHARALSEDEMREFMPKLKSYSGNLSTQISVHLIVMLMCRTVEVRKGRWEEVDLEAREWKIPAERMKMGRPHIVPLPDQAIELFKQLHVMTGNTPLLCPSFRNPEKPINKTSHNMALRYMGYKWGELSMHDFRATGSTFFYERGYRSEAIELQLAHVEKKQSKRAYNHAEYLEERRGMLQDYADWLDGLMDGIDDYR